MVSCLSLGWLCLSVHQAARSLSGPARSLSGGMILQLGVLCCACCSVLWRTVPWGKLTMTRQPLTCRWHVVVSFPVQECSFLGSACGGLCPSRSLSPAHCLSCQLSSGRRLLSPRQGRVASWAHGSLGRVPCALWPHHWCCDNLVTCAACVERPSDSGARRALSGVHVSGLFQGTELKAIVRSHRFWS